MKRELTCIICPRGCGLTVDINGDNVSVSGNLLYFSCALFGSSQCLDNRYNK